MKYTFLALTRIHDPKLMVVIGHLTSQFRASAEVGEVFSGTRLLARQASAMPLLGSEPVLGIPKCLVRETIRNSTETQHLRAWIDLSGLRYGKLFIDRPCKDRADDLLKLGRHQLKMTIAIYTGHAPVRGTCLLWACLMGIQSADFMEWRPKQCSTSFAVARHWLTNAMSLGGLLSNQRT